MSDHAAKKTTSSIENPTLDVHMFLLGLMKYDQNQGLTSTFTNVATGSPIIPDNTPPIKEVQILDFVGTVGGGFNFNTSFDIKEPTEEELKKIEQIQKNAQRSFAELGMESAFDDGIITKEELLLAGAARGNLHLEKDQNLLEEITDDIYSKAEEIIEKHGIIDPDGTIVRGIAIQSVRMALNANQGLCLLNSEQTPKPQSPQEFAPSKVTINAPAANDLNF